MHVTRRVVVLGCWAAALSLPGCSIDDRTLRLGDSGVVSDVRRLRETPDGGSGLADGPQLVVAQTALDFGAAVTGFAALGRVVVANGGNAPVGAPLFTLAEGSDPDFSIAQDQCGRELAGGQRCDVRLQLVPSKPGALHAALQIESDPGGMASVELRGEGLSPGDIVLAPAPGGVTDFGDVLLDTSAEAVFRVTNPVEADSGVLQASLSTSDVFTLVAPGEGACAFGTTSLAAGQGCDVRVAFQPNARGPREATLSVSSPGIGSASLALQGRGRAPGALGVSPATVDFAGIVLGKAGTAQLEVFNSGDDPVTVAGVTLDGETASAFQIAGTECAEGAVLEGGDSPKPCTVDLLFQPAAAAAAAAALHVASTAGLEVAVPLAGLGLLPGALGIAPSGGAMLDPGGALDLGDIVVGESLVQALVVSNGGAEASGTILFSASGGVTLLPPAAEGDCESGVTTLIDGQSCTLSVRLAPTERAALSGALTMTSELIGSASLAIRARGISKGVLKLLADDVNFGRVVLGAAAPASLSLRNDGDRPLAPPTVAVGKATSGNAAAFTVENGCTAELAPAAECSIDLTFSPSAAGAHSATLEVGAADAGGGTVLLLGEGLEPGSLEIAPAGGGSAAFGDVARGATVERSFTVTNAGGVASGRLSITSTSNRFVPDEGDCNPPGGSGLVDGSSCTFSVKFTPATSAAVTATLNIDSPGAGAASLPLSGRGRNPAVLSGSSEFNFDTVIVSELSAARTWRVTNGGDLPTGALRTSGATADFVINDDGCTGQVLPPAGACSMGVRFAPQQGGSRLASIEVSDTAAGGSRVTLAARGVGQTLPPVGEACLAGRCAGSATCEIHSNGETQVCCAVACTGRRCDAAQDFAACTLPEVGPGEACGPTVVCGDGFSCTPAQAGRCCATGCTGACQTCRTDGSCGTVDDGERGGCAANQNCQSGACTDVPLLRAALLGSEAALDFGTVIVGTDSTGSSFDVTNVGEQATIGLSVSPLSAFVSSGCDGVVLAGGESCTVSVTFRPLTPSFASEDVTVSAGAGVTTAVVTLAGTGVCPEGQIPTDSAGVTICAPPPVVLVDDGGPCLRPTDCVSGICSPWHADNDGDGFGNIVEQRFCGVVAPPGLIADGSDCCDELDPDADPSTTTTPDFVHPGITQPDSRPARACPRAFDFNCDGEQTPSALPDLFEACDANCLVSPGPRENTGVDPGCGETYVLKLCFQNPDDLSCTLQDGGLLQIQTCL
jgi:ASPM-SPD-2-Hydin domain-containing protein